MARPLQRLDPRQVAAPHSRRRVFLFGGLAALLFIVLFLLIGATFFLPPFRDRGGEIPNPIRMVKDLLFPPPLLVIIDKEIVTSEEDPFPTPPIPDDDTASE